MQMILSSNDFIFLFILSKILIKNKFNEDDQ